MAGRCALNGHLTGGSDRAAVHRGLAHLAQTLSQSLPCAVVAQRAWCEYNASAKLAAGDLTPVKILKIEVKITRLAATQRENVRLRQPLADLPKQTRDARLG